MGTPRTPLRPLRKVLRQGSFPELLPQLFLILKEQLVAITAPVSEETLIPEVKKIPALVQLEKDWGALGFKDRSRLWEETLSALAHLAYQTRPYCIRCGTCCRKSSPTLFKEDLPLLLQGHISKDEVYTLRQGEKVGHPKKKEAVTLKEERIKIRENPQAGGCIFLSEDGNHCRIYAHRPLQCRLQKCWEPASFEAMNRHRPLTRWDVLSPDHPLVPVLKAHAERCNLSLFHTLLKTLPRTPQLEDQIQDMVLYDLHAREFLEQKMKLSKGATLFLFGRPLLSASQKAA